MLSRRIAVLLMIVLPTLALAGGCATSRYDQLRSKSARIDSALLRERDKAVALPADSPQRRQRIEHLSKLRNELSAVNVGLTGVRRAMPDNMRDIAYDVLEQAYDTINWNIPLGPGDILKPMPNQFSGGVLKLQ
jgi:hypothetical protein